MALAHTDTVISSDELDRWHSTRNEEFSRWADRCLGVIADSEAVQLCALRYKGFNNDPELSRIYMDALKASAQNMEHSIRNLSNQSTPASMTYQQNRQTLRDQAFQACSDAKRVMDNL